MRIISLGKLDHLRRFGASHDPIQTAVKSGIMMTMTVTAALTDRVTASIKPEIAVAKIPAS